MTIPWTNITAIDIGLDHLHNSGGDLQKALQSPHARTEASLAWLFQHLAGNKKAVDAIRRVAEELDAAIVEKTDESIVEPPSIEQYVADFLACISFRTRF